MPRRRKPRALARGATLGIAAPGGPIDAGLLEAGEALLREAGFRTFRREDVLARHGYLAGDDARRVEEFMGLVEDPRVDGIVCARGGYGCDRIVPRLDAARVREAAKPLVGYSDATALLLWQWRCAGLVGFHGPMLDRGSDLDPEAVLALTAWLCGEAALPLTLRGCAGGGGRADGRLLGGSLTLVVSSLGTPWEVDTRGAILLLEDVAEQPYRIDRMLQQLRGAGKLRSVAGIGIGAFSGCDDHRYPQTAESVLDELTRELSVPWVSGLPFGHVRRNLPWPLGTRATLDGDAGELRILEQGVARAA